MKKEDLVAKGLSEEHAQIVVDAWNETMKVLSGKLIAAPNFKLKQTF